MLRSTRLLLVCAFAASLAACAGTVGQSTSDASVTPDTPEAVDTGTTIHPPTQPPPDVMVADVPAVDVPAVDACGPCGCGYTGRMEGAVAMRPEFCRASAHPDAGPPPDVLVASSDAGADAASDGAAGESRDRAYVADGGAGAPGLVHVDGGADRVGCQTDCAIACAGVTLTGAGRTLPWSAAAGGTCTTAAARVICVMIVACDRAP